MSSVPARVRPHERPDFSRFPVFIRRCLTLSLPRFLAVGCVGLATDATVFSVFSAAEAADGVARVLSISVGTFVTWQLNRRFTFGASGRRAHAEALRYAAVALCAQGFNLAVFLVLRKLLPSLPALGALVASAVLAAGFSFTGQSLVTFRSRLAEAAPFPFGARS